MRKFIPKIIILLGILIGSIMACNISYAATSDAMQKYLSGESYFDVKGYKSTAPVEENAAGDEIINNFSGTLNYSTTDFVLEGKNGMDIALTRNLQSNQEITDTRLHYYGFMADFDNEPVRRNKAYLVKYFIDGSTTNYCYVLFRTLEEMLAAEDENHSFGCQTLSLITPTQLYSSTEGLSIGNTAKFTNSAGITTCYKYEAVYSSNPKQTLTRDTTTSPIIANGFYRSYVRETGGAAENIIDTCLGYSISLPTMSSPITLYTKFEDERIRESEFYDIETGEKLYYSVFYTRINSTKNGYFTCDLTNSKGSTTNRYHIVDNRSIDDIPNDNVDGIIIERYDGKRFYFADSGTLQKIEDRFGNAIVYDFTILEDGTFTTITDTYGRIIRFKKTEENDIKTVRVYVDDILKMEYTEENENNFDVDPENIMKYDNIYKLSAHRIKDDNTKETVIYYIKQLENTWDADSNAFRYSYEIKRSCAIDHIILPTGAEKHYRYRMFNKDIIDDYAYEKREFVLSEKWTQTAENPTEKYNHVTYALTDRNSHVSYPVKLTITDHNSTTTELFYKPQQNSISSKMLYSRQKVYTNGTTTTEYYSYGGSINPVVTSLQTHQNYCNGTNVITNQLTTYNNYDLPTSKKLYKNGDTVNTAVTNITYGDYMQVLTQENLVSGNIYTGIQNTLSDDGKTIVKSQNYKRDGTDYTYYETTEFEHDQYGNVIKTIAKNGNEDVITDITYDYSPAEENVLYTVSSTINDVENLTSDTNNITTTVKYDVMGNTIYSQDGNGNVTTSSYDYRNRPVLITKPNNSTNSYTYNTQLNEVKVTLENGTKEKIKYDSIGRETARYIKSPGGEYIKTSENTYDSWGKLLTQSIYSEAGTTPKSVMYYTYNNDDTISSQTVKEGDTVLSKREYVYTNPLVTTVKVYSSDTGYTQLTETKDVFGNVTTQQIIADNITYNASATYDLAGNQLTSTDFKGNTTSYEYDHQGRITKTTNALGTSATVTYDDLGRKISETDYNGNTTLFEYNKLNLPVLVANPLGGTTKTYYDKNGNTTKTITDATTSKGIEKFLTTEYEYNSMNKPLWIRTADGYTKYEYDLSGNLLKVFTGLRTKDTSNAVADTTYEYDWMNRNTKSINTQNNAETYTYDLIGNMTSKTDRNNNVFTFTYDGLGKLLTNTVGNDIISYTYDYMGNITQMQDSSGTTNYAYNGLGMLLSEQKGNYTSNYTYDNNGNRITYNLLNGTTNEITAAYTYDSLNRMTSVTSNGETENYEYDSNGNITFEENSNHNVAYQYNSLNLNVNMNSSITWLSCSTSNSKNGNIDAVATNNDPANYNYTYDSMNRLKSETIEFTQNDSNTLTKSYFYDSKGNIIGTLNIDENQISDVANTYEYDARNRLIRVKNPDGTTLAEYTYNGNNLRQSKTVNGVTTNYVYDGSNVVLTDKPGEKQIFIRGKDIIFRTVNDGAKEYYHYNIVGDIVYVADTNSSTVGEYYYDAFGNKTEKSAPTYENPFGYRGELHDSETGFIYLRNRYYDPSIGRFTTEDPARDGLNWYIYCENNPVMFVDPWGYWASDGSDERFKDSNPVVYYALGALSDTWTKLDSLEGKTIDNRIDISQMKNEVAQLANDIRSIGDSITVNEPLVLGERLNYCEMVLYASNPSKAQEIIWAGYSSREKTKQLYGDGYAVNDNSDAFRHSYWNAASTSLVGATFTKQMTNAHEYGYASNFSEENIASTYMDLYNNSIGRYQGAKLGLGVSETAIVEAIIDRVDSGGLLKIVNKNLVTTNSTGRVK